MADTQNLNQGRVTTGKPYSGGVAGLAAGAIFVGPENAEGKATLPTSATSALPDGYKCLGYITSDGVSNGFSVSTSEIKAWGGDTLLNPLESFAETYGFTCAELNEKVLKTVWGDGNVTGTDETGLTIDHGPEGFDAIRVFVVICAYQDGSVGLKVIPKGQLSNLDNITYQDTAVVGHAVTISALAGGFGDDAPRVTSREYKSKPGAINGTASLNASATVKVEK